MARRLPSLVALGFLALVILASFFVFGPRPLLVFPLAGLWSFGHDGPLTDPVDFRAFYCGGHVLFDGADPYRYGPLRACQAAVLAAGGLRLDASHVLPAPLPPAALAVFGILGFLPFRFATEVWLVASILAVACTIYAVGALTRLRVVAVCAVLIGSLGIASLLLGQLVPLALAGLLVAALAIRRGDGIVAALGATLGGLEPHLALPVWVSLALFVPASRRPLVASAVAISCVSAAWGSLTAEYVATVLPAHARSELFNVAAQYGLPTVLAAFGVPDRVALLAGCSSYALTLALGLYVGFRLSRRFADPAFLVVTPLATVLIGGPFVHIHQMAAAVPLALLLYTRVSALALRGLVLAAIVALAVRWQAIAELPAFADRATDRSQPHAAIVLKPPRPDDPIEVSYTAFIDAFARQRDRRSLAEQLAWKVPTWFGLLAVTILAWSAGGCTKVRGVPSDPQYA